MRKAVVALIAVASILLLGARPSGPPPQLITGDAPALEVDVSVTPVTKDEYQPLRRIKPGMYRASVLILDAERREGGWGDEVVVSPGEKRETRQTLGPLELYFSAGVDKSAERARILVSITRTAR